LDLPRFKRMVFDLTPRSVRDEFHHVSTRAGSAVAAFVRGQLLVAVIVGALSSVALLALDLPFWLIIGLAAGLLNLVPFVGPFVGGLLAVIVALVEGEPSKAALAVLLFTAIQQVDNHIITPMVQRTRVLLSPLVIVLALLVGGSVAGLLGVLVAVPLVAVIRIVAGHLWRTRVLGESWEVALEAAIEVTERPERRRARPHKLQDERLFDTSELRPTEADEPVTTEL
jgi:predicted PurR-regulated permease PerM